MEEPELPVDPEDPDDVLGVLEVVLDELLADESLDEDVLELDVSAGVEAVAELLFPDEE